MKHYCVIGYPVSHSLSPKIHNKWFKKFYIPARYEAREVKPADLAKFMRNFRKQYAGANVTIPHKERIIKFLDELSPEARAIGAVNCIVKRGGKLKGFNTDVFGAMKALEYGIRNMECGNGRWKMENGKGVWKMLNGRKVVVLGAGGAARAVVYGLKKAGAKVTILNRTLARAKKLAKEFGCDYMSLRAVISSRGRRKVGRSNLVFDILINTTSVGMWPNIHDSPLPYLSKILQTPLVFDIIYRPLLTKLLRDAKKAGCKIITGDKMFLAQAAKSFELWTGKSIYFLLRNSAPVTSGGGGVSSGSSSP